MEDNDDDNDFVIINNDNLHEIKKTWKEYFRKLYTNYTIILIIIIIYFYYFYKNNF